MKKIVCFSGGHSSALAAIETARKYGTEGMILLNHDISPHVEHEDIKRFKLEAAEYIGLPVTYANMPGWETTPPLAVAVAKRRSRLLPARRSAPAGLKQSRFINGWKKTVHPATG